MDVTNACCQEVYAKISDRLALLGICALAHADHAVLFAADGTNLSLDGHSLAVCLSNQLGGLLYVLFQSVMRTIKHDGGETCLDALVAALYGTMIQMQCNGNVNVKVLKQAIYHANDYVIAAHVLACALGYAKDHGAL